MKRLLRILLLTALTAAPGALRAQEELPGPGVKARAEAEALMLGEPLRIETQWLREAVNPILRERNRLRRIARERADATADAIVQTRPHGDPSIEVGRWMIDIGNATDGNWSPYPDRALDARTIRFPVPRGARADKRSGAERCLDRMRSGN